MTFPRRLLASVVLAASLVGCSGAARPSATDDVPVGGPISEIDTCSLLSQTEIATAIGKPVGPGVREEVVGTASGCEWEGQNDADAVAVTLSIDELDLELWDVEKGTEGVEQMPGIGEDAIRGWITPNLLLVRHETMEIALTVIAVYEDDSVIKSAQDTLGKLIVSRL